MGTELISFDYEYTTPGVYTLRYVLRLKKGEETVCSLGNVFYIFVSQKPCTHNYELISNTATCTESGTTTEKCTECGDTKTTEFEAFGHTFAEYDWSKTWDKHWQYCYRCDRIFNEGEHKYTDNVCDVCSYEKNAATTILGDINADKEVTMLDVVMLQKAIAKLVKLTDEEKTAADVNFDGQTTMEDVVLIQKYIAKLINSFDKKLILYNLKT